MMDLSSGHQISTKHIYVPIFEDVEQQQHNHLRARPLNPELKILKPGKPTITKLKPISNDNFTLQKVFHLYKLHNFRKPGKN